jgi:hypothetical protein
MTFSDGCGSHTAAPKTKFHLCLPKLGPKLIVNRRKRGADGSLPQYGYRIEMPNNHFKGGN